MPTLMNTSAMPVSWQIGRWPSARHAAVGQDLRDGILRRGRLLALVGLAQRRDVVERVVIADELEGIGDGLDQVFLADGGGHGGAPVQCFVTVSVCIMILSV
jgi:hypothetical protein